MIKTGYGLSLVIRRYISLHVCWTTQHSTSILLGTSITLAQGLISQVKSAIQTR
jgi:hypothetical protein